MWSEPFCGSSQCALVLPGVAVHWGAAVSLGLVPWLQTTMSFPTCLGPPLVKGVFNPQSHTAACLSPDPPRT